MVNSSLVYTMPLTPAPAAAFASTTACLVFMAATPAYNPTYVATTAGPYKNVFTCEYVFCFTKLR